MWQQDEILRELTLSVNVSAKQFLNPGFVAQVQEVVGRNDIVPTKLEIELTESMLVDDIENIIEVMNTLAEMGICFSLVDFGTGYSCLQYLKRLPLNKL